MTLDIKDKLRDFINQDLLIFQVILLVFNIFVFVIFLFLFEKRLQKRVTKPIQELTREIKDPKKYFNKESNFDNLHTEARQSQMQGRDTLEGDNRETLGTFTNVRGRSTQQSPKREVTEKQFGLSTDKFEKGQTMELKKKKKGPIDEVQALRQIFYTFFNANTTDKA